jgi:hypothetical protein
MLAACGDSDDESSELKPLDIDAKRRRAAAERDNGINSPRIKRDTRGSSKKPEVLAVSVASDSGLATSEIADIDAALAAIDATDRPGSRLSGRPRARSAGPGLGSLGPRGPQRKSQPSLSFRQQCEAQVTAAEIDTADAAFDASQALQIATAPALVAVPPGEDLKYRADLLVARANRAVSASRLRQQALREKERARESGKPRLNLFVREKRAPAGKGKMQLSKLNGRSSVTVKAMVSVTDGRGHRAGIDGGGDLLPVVVPEPEPVLRKPTVDVTCLRHSGSTQVHLAPVAWTFVCRWV